METTRIPLKCPKCLRMPEMWHERAAMGSRELFWVGCRKCGHIDGAISQPVVVELWNRYVNRFKFEQGGSPVKKLLFFMVLCLVTVGCSKKEDAPPPAVPHVSGQWDGTGTDNTIGWYRVSVNLTQAGDSAAGTYTTTSGYGTTKGRIQVNLKPGMGLNLTSVTMTRDEYTGSVRCAGNLSLANSSSMTDTKVSFSYKVTDCDYTNEDGGLNLTKTAGLN